MNIQKKIVAVIISIILTVLPAGAAFSAPSYRDVSTNHWAYESISYVSDRGFMVGDASGNFRPNDLLDKFETSKTFAMAAGYKYTGITAAEQNEFNKAYDTYKSLTNQYSRAFTRWDSSADKEISYLLYKGILTEDDLFQFVIRDVDGTERRRALSKEEAAVFLVRLIGKADEARTWRYSGSFNDDSSISPTYKPYVYYLRDKGVIAASGDSLGNFNPKTGATRATLAHMMHLTLTIGQETGTTVPTTPTPITSNDFITRIETISGFIDKLYPSLSGLQVITATNDKIIYKLSANVTVYIDNNLRTLNDLKEGMPFIGVLNNGELVDIKAQTTTPAYIPPTTGTSETETVFYTIEGTIKNVNAAAESFTIELRMLSPRGEIITEIRPYTLASNAVVTRDGVQISLNTIVPGDIAKIQFYGNTVSSINVEIKDRTITGGILLEKKLIELTNTPILVIQDTNGRKHELRVDDDTIINRRGYGRVEWGKLRVGDTIDLTAEYDKLLTVYAVGTTSTVEGTIVEIHITLSRAYIHLKDLQGNIQSYEIIREMTDPYTLRLNNRVILKLDSLEVEAVTVIGR